MQILEKFGLPNNLYTRLIKQVMTENLANRVVFSETPLLMKRLLSGEYQAVLVPVFELLNKDEEELFISSKYGLVLENDLSLSFLYFPPDTDEIEEIQVAGDVSSQDILLTKILLKESFEIEPKISLASKEEKPQASLLLSGDLNFAQNRFMKGMNIAEHVAELLTLPYVSYILVSKSKDVLEELHHEFTGLNDALSELVETGGWDSGITPEVTEFLRVNVASIVLELIDDDRKGIEQLVQLPYFHQVVDEIPELRFV